MSPALFSRPQAAAQSHASTRARRRTKCTRRVRGNWGAQPVEGAEPKDGDLVLERARMSSFHGTQLDIWLRNLGIDTVIVAGRIALQQGQHTGAGSGKMLRYRREAFSE